MAVYDDGFAPAAGGSRTGVYANYAGAAMSLALIIGVAFWGYKLIMRDVSGIPVVRAMEGEMRVLPDNPGGDVARHTGLSVNEVAAVGEAGGPEDRLVLAPRTTGLAEADLAVQPTAEADEIVPAETEQVSQAALRQNVDVQQTDISTDDILALADQIASEATQDDQPDVEIIARSVPGVAVSQRPTIRPASLQILAAAEAPATAPQQAAPAEEVAISTTAFEPGTPLVQLGAFRSPTLAASEWERLQRRFGELLTDRERVIQVSNQSSGTWYRLRTAGFDDLAAARRFCAALSAEGASCNALLVN
ncbi:SPOR domain-containing protein [Yoonia sp. 2307UL14-13]|uniref:SPOR domain-containing protein n=1 Tax=Yoonia sp. 2307UL14-13 TaxID=3126506 RepID=UPI0030A5A672